ncbi:MAG: DUF4412 domain-containing protein, partial [Bacteroidota bacterium]
EMDPMAQEMMKDMTMTMAIQDKKSRIEMDMGSMMSMVTVFSSEEKKSVVLMDMMGQKIAQVSEGEDFDEQIATQQDLKVTKTSESKKIAGYTCYKALIENPDGDGEFEIWFTEDIKVGDVDNPYIYAGIEGFPLEMVVSQQGMYMRMKALSVSTQRMPDSDFSTEIPAGYVIKDN